MHRIKIGPRNRPIISLRYAEAVDASSFTVHSTPWLALNSRGACQSTYSGWALGAGTRANCGVCVAVQDGGDRNAELL